jgi:ParB family transcriptional regulator, chromosome partitioning protein
LLAVCAAACVDTIQKADRSTDDSIAARAGELATALKLDMADYWQPTAAGYFSRVSKEQTLAAIEQACGAGAKAGFVTLKKAALADATEKNSKARAGCPKFCGRQRNAQHTGSGSNAGAGALCAGREA